MRIHKMTGRNSARLAVMIIFTFFAHPLQIGVVGSPGEAAGVDFGYQGPPTTGVGSPPTGSKPESKLWWNDGFWWASMWDSVSADYHIFRLDVATQTWIDTGVLLDARNSSRADVLWDGSKLYVASHRFTESSPSSGLPSNLWRFSYNSSTQQYTLDTGFPVAINLLTMETLVIAKDSTGKLWATWPENNQVFINRTLGDDLTWGTPIPLPATGTTGNITPDDISSIIAFGGNKIGVMWSNQNTPAFHFAVHVDGQPDDSWSATETALGGAGIAEDHINLKTDGSGRVYAAIKTNLTGLSETQTALLVRDPATAIWTSSPFGTVADSHTRPIVLIDEEHGNVHMFATGPQAPNTNGDLGGTIYEKVSPLSSISFPTGAGTPVISNAASITGTAMNNATSTKQNVDGTTGLVVLALNSETGHYWHHYDPLSQNEPIAEFSGDPTSGPSPLIVQFTDESTGNPTTWAWDFENDGTVDSSVQDPEFTYLNPGSYTVKLTVTAASGTDTEIKNGYIQVGPAVPCPKGADFWKNHPSAWPVTTLVLGDETYTQAELLALLGAPVRSDASLILAKALIAAKLSVANGSDPALITATIVHADLLFSGFSGKLPYRVRTNSRPGKAMLRDASRLERFNDGELTSGCSQDDDDDDDHDDDD